MSTLSHPQQTTELDEGFPVDWELTTTVPRMTVTPAGHVPTAGHVISKPESRITLTWCRGQAAGA
ncbi:hypothetical protein HET68_15000 [Streptomyces sp. McG8]|nr:hypothetical protein [Streptomyces sp. McG8]